MIERTAVLTLATPLHHGSEKSRIKPEQLPAGAKTNYTPHRRLPIMLKSGEDYQTNVLMPAVSGNSIRHMLRESLVDVTLHTLGLTRKDLPKNVLETLVSGGGMDATDVAKNDDEEEKQEKAKKSTKKTLAPSVPILVRDRETLRAAMPILSLFGCSYGNRMVPGNVNIGWAIPALKETQHITNVPSSIMYSEDMTSYQLMTRHDPFRDELQEDEKSRQSIYYMEVVSPGTPFAHSYSIGLSTPIERSAFQLAINLFKEKPFLGGKGSTGHGKIQTDQWYPDLDESPSLYLEFLEKNRDVIVEYINLWNKPENVIKIVKGKESIEFPEGIASELDRLIQEREAAIQEEIRKNVERLKK